MRIRKGGENKERYLRRRQCGKEREEEQEREGTRTLNAWIGIFESSYLFS